MKRWTQIFKALANINRLRIIRLLADGDERTGASVAREIHVTFKGTSQHLILFHTLDVLRNVGKAGHVFYSLNREMPADVKRAVDLMLK